jgi:hypothetical protein
MNGYQRWWYSTKVGSTHETRRLRTSLVMLITQAIALGNGR